MKKIMTLCFIHESDKVLLGMKKRGFGMGKWNGFGGKVRPGESLEETAKRELFEEIGIEVRQLDKRGLLHFRNEGDEELIEVHVYRVMAYAGQPVEGEEMKPQWFDVGDIPYEEMWIDDPLWLPLYLADKLFYGKFLFKGFRQVIEHSVEEVEGFDIN